MAMKKKEMGSDRGAKAKAVAAKNKRLSGRQVGDTAGSSATRVYPNKKEPIFVARKNPESGKMQYVEADRGRIVTRVGPGVGRTEQRGIDQAKRAKDKKKTKPLYKNK
jgi:hypothetical protein